MQYEQLNEKYHILRKDINPNSLFSSFKAFRYTTPYKHYSVEERPPYPILIDDPTVGQVLHNMNKSDVLVGLCFVSLGFVSSLIITRQVHTLKHKFTISRALMWWHTAIGMLAATSCSFLRLKGYLENGLRWKQKDMLYSKYDFTKDFEANTIFKNFRVRID
jgi:hypothetical protein